jgi:hypothetical protein
MAFSFWNWLLQAAIMAFESYSLCNISRYLVLVLKLVFLLQVLLQVQVFWDSLILVCWLCPEGRDLGISVAKILA